MSKPIPPAHDTPSEPRKGAADSSRPRKSTEPLHRGPPDVRRTASEREPIASKLLGLAKQENPGVAAGAMGATNTHAREPESAPTTLPNEGVESNPVTVRTSEPAPKSAKPNRPPGKRS